MLRLIPSETALVLGGGGAKGAYEIGAIEALHALGIQPLRVYGVSIGALNAAMYAQGRMDEAAALWQTISLDDVVADVGELAADDVEALFDHPEKLLDFAKRYAHMKGMDTAPLRALLRAHVDEARMRSSPVRFGLLATRFPSMTMAEMRLDEMESGSLHDWLMASASCFPFFPMTTIGGERYIDGGFCDNAPVGMAIRDGARHVIAIDIGKHRSHAQFDRRPNVTYIRASHPLGSLLGFDAARSAKNRILGYNDTMRAFGRLRGTAYAFDAEDAQALYARATDFVVRLTGVEARLQSASALGLRDGVPLFATLEEALAPGADAIDYLLRACELCADIAGVEPAQVFTFARFVDDIRMQLPLEKAETMLDSLLGGRVGVLLTAPQPDRRLIIACLYHLLAQGKLFNALTLRLLGSFPTELLCALTLREIL